MKIGAPFAQWFFVSSPILGNVSLKQVMYNEKTEKIKKWDKLDYRDGDSSHLSLTWPVFSLYKFAFQDETQLNRNCWVKIPIYFDLRLVTFIWGVARSIFFYFEFHSFVYIWFFIRAFREPWKFYRKRAICLCAQKKDFGWCLANFLRFEAKTYPRLIKSW